MEESKAKAAAAKGEPYLRSKRVLSRLSDAYDENRFTHFSIITLAGEDRHDEVGDFAVCDVRFGKGVHVQGKQANGRHHPRDGG
eukprot:4439314-Pyramimonas_sp.AAC.4